MELYFFSPLTISKPVHLLKNIAILHPLYINWRTMYRNLGFVLFLWLLGTQAAAQTIDSRVVEGDTAQLHELHTRRGDIFFGTLLGQTADSIFFRLRSDLEFQLAAKDVESVRLASDVPAALPGRRKSIGEPDPAPEYLLFSPTAFNFKKGHGEYRNTLLSLNQVDVGLSNHFSIGGTFILPALAGVHAKVNAELSPNTRLALGGAVYTAFFDGGAAAHIYGAVSKGTPDKFINLTLGAAGTFDGNWIPVFSGGGAYRFHQHWRLMGDIAYSPNLGDAFILPSLSFSWFNARHRVDFGLLSLSVLPIPIPHARYGLRF